MIGWSMPTALYRAVASMAVRSIGLQVIASVLGRDDDDDDLLLEDDDEEDDRDRVGPKDRRQVDVPPYVA